MRDENFLETLRSEPGKNNFELSDEPFISSII